jgi:hypothetical protein
MKLNKFIVVAGLLVLVAILSCNKKIDTIAKVFVKDVYGSPVSNCQVILKGISTINKTSTLADTASTNSKGEAIFNFNYIYQKGQAGVAVLDIFADKEGIKGTGIIQVKEETTSEAKVVIQ